MSSGVLPRRRKDSPSTSSFANTTLVRPSAMHRTTLSSCSRGVFLPSLYDSLGLGFASS